MRIIGLNESTKKASLATVDDNGSVNIPTGATYNINGSPHSHNWHPITAFIATPASTSTLSMTADLTASIPPGVGLRYVIGGSVYYGILFGLTSTLATISGAPFTGDVSEFSWTHIPLIPISFAINGYFADTGTLSLIKDDITKTKSPGWYGYFARCVFFQISRTSNDSGATQQPKVNLIINNNALLTTPLTLPAPGTTKVRAVVEFNPDNYKIVFDNDFDIQIIAATDGNPQNNALDVLVETMWLPGVV